MEYVDSEPKQKPERRFRFSLRTLFATVCVLSVLLAVTNKIVQQLQVKKAANRAIVHIQMRKGKVTVGSPSNATTDEVADYSDLRNATSVTFSGTTLAELDYRELSKIPSLASLRIANAPIDLEGLMLLRNLPNLQLLVLENTGADELTFNKIKGLNSKWQVFASEADLRQWSLEKWKR